MKFSLLVGGAAARDLFQAPAASFRGSQTVVQEYPAVYQAAGYAGPEMVPTVVSSPYTEESSTSWLPPAVVALAIAGYAVSRSSRSALPQEDAGDANQRTVAMLGLMGSEKAGRREAIAKAAGAALASLATVQAASAKAGQFSKIDVFSIVGEPPISSPYQPGGPKAGPNSTFGYQKTEGEFLAKGFQSDVTRETAAYKVSKGIIESQGPNIESKTWWLVRDNLRGQAYNIKANMRAMNAVLDESIKGDAERRYKKFVKKLDDLDLACRLKEQDLARKNYGECLEALAKYEEILPL